MISRRLLAKITISTLGGKESGTEAGLCRGDSQVSFAIAKGLRFGRIDVTTTADAGLFGCPDL